MPEKTKLWYLQNFNLFNKMDQSSMEMMDHNSKMKKSSKKEIIYFPEERSDNIYLLKEGKVKISRVSEDSNKHNSITPALWVNGNMWFAGDFEIKVFESKLNKLLNNKRRLL